MTLEEKSSPPMQMFHKNEDVAKGGAPSRVSTMEIEIFKNKPK